jgi:predicted N-formylglutamate amidohydrolase
MNSSARYTLLLSCIHATNRVPEQFRKCFATTRGARALNSHRGWDIGALRVSQELARHLNTQLHATTVSRLIVDGDYFPESPDIFSEFSKRLSVALQRTAVKKYYLPHRTRIEKRVRQEAAKHSRVLHLNIHSFVSRLEGRTRNVDVGLLFDPSRAAEKHYCVSLRERLREHAPHLRVHFNAPYTGASEGFPTYLRRCFSAKHYVGIEIEINQSLLTKSPAKRSQLIRALKKSLSECVF